MYEQRIKTVRRNLANRGLEQMLVCDPRSIHYLTGAFIEPGERFLGLIVGSDARPTLVQIGRASCRERVSSPV